MRLPIEEFRLTNGMRFLLLERADMPTVEAGWVVDAGSADDPPGASGLAHFVEHMMFKGTRTVGSLDWRRERAVRQRLVEVGSAMAALSTTGRRAKRRRIELERELAELATEAATLSRLGAFSLEYSRAGASRLNANTAEDLTLYYVTLPAEAIELWFWLESDRLREPVFREFAKEKQVVAEERRQRIESTPTGAADLEFDAAFWRDSPYARPPLGRFEDVAALTRSRLEAYVQDRYRPARVTAVLVGNFDSDRVRTLAHAYFGRLQPRGPDRPPHGGDPALRADFDFAARPPDGTTPDGPMKVNCGCPSQVRVRYSTVPFGHADQYSLQALAGLLNGRDGRLYRNLVLGREIAFAAFAQQTPLRRAGSFTVTLEAKGETTHQALLAAWDLELARIVATPPTPHELSRAQRRLATESLDLLKDPHLLMRRLLVYAGLGDWSQLAAWTGRVAAVEPGEVSAVAKRHLTAERRLVAFYTGSEDVE